MINFVNFNDDIFIYFLGRYWADGYSRYPSLDCKRADLIHLKPWLKSFGFKIKLRQSYRNGKKWGKPQSRVSFCRSNFSILFLRDNGFFEKSRSSPSIILSKIPADRHYLFWRGFFDGDGCIQCSKNIHKRGKKEIAFWGSINQDWSDLIHLLNKLQIKYTKRAYIRKCGKSSCICFYAFKSMINFCEYIYSNFDDRPIGLKRKWKTYQRLIKCGNRKKTSIYLGICFCRSNGKWRAGLEESETKGKQVYLGWFKTEKDALQAKQEAIQKL